MKNQMKMVIKFYENKKFLKCDKDLLNLLKHIIKLL